MDLQVVDIKRSNGVHATNEANAMQQPHQWQQTPHQGQIGQQAPVAMYSWSGTAKQNLKATTREWLGLGALAMVIGAAALGLSWLSSTAAGLVFVVGYGVLVTRAIGLASRVGESKPLALDSRGLWFDGALLFPRETIQRFNLLMTSRAASVDGVGVRAFAGGLQVLATTGKTWFELSVPADLVHFARSLGMQVVDPPGPPGGV